MEISVENLYVNLYVDLEQSCLVLKIYRSCVLAY